MSTASPVSASASQIPPRRLRLWPGVLIVAVLWAFFAVVQSPRLVLDNQVFLNLLQYGPMTIIGAFLVWWLFLSRAPWLDRVETLLVCCLAAVAVVPFIHSS